MRNLEKLYVSSIINGIRHNKEIRNCAGAESHSSLMKEIVATSAVIRNLLEEGKHSQYEKAKKHLEELRNFLLVEKETMKTIYENQEDELLFDDDGVDDLLDGEWGEEEEEDDYDEEEDEEKIKYLCPNCGEVTATMKFEDVSDEQDGNYCIKCLLNHLTKVTPIEAKPEVVTTVEPKET